MRNIEAIRVELSKIEKRKEQERNSKWGNADFMKILQVREEALMWVLEENDIGV